jgi:prephenate dehydrogenase
LPPRVAEDSVKLALIGVGLIGGSAAAAWRAAGAMTHVTGFDIDAAAAEKGRALKVLDEAAKSLPLAVADADVVLVAVPVLAMHGVFDEIARHAPQGAIVTDVGSTKVSVMQAARAAFGSRGPAALARFVPGHPIAGREMPGVECADATLFRNKLVITTPGAETDPSAATRVESFWHQAGARVARMEAAEHDRIFAAVSHLPHLLAFGLVASIAAEADGERKLEFAGAGFRDFTRIAASSPAMWRDVCLANRDALGEELQRYRALLDRLQQAIERGDAGTLERTFATASNARRRHAPTLDAE